MHQLLCTSSSSLSAESSVELLQALSLVASRVLPSDLPLAAPSPIPAALLLRENRFFVVSRPSGSDFCLAAWLSLWRRASLRESTIKANNQP